MTQVVTRPLAYYIRGLNTSGSDRIRLGIIDLGPMHRALEKNLQEKGVELRLVKGLDVGTLSEMTDRATDFIVNDPDYQRRERPLHLIGHSAGGLVARLALKKLLDPTRTSPFCSHLTLATPHHGANLATRILNTQLEAAPLFKILRVIGYDIAERKKRFHEYVPTQIASTMPTDDSHAWHSILCSSPQNKWSWPLRLAYRLGQLARPESASDGIVQLDSQRYGRTLGHFELDHLAQVGIFANRKEFDRLGQTIADFIHSESRK